MASENQWRRCSACKKAIALGSVYWTCNVSTCNRKRTGLVFCSVSCWEVHLPSANHREAWAVEQTAPLSLDEKKSAANADEAINPAHLFQVRRWTTAHIESETPAATITRFSHALSRKAGYFTAHAK